MRKPTRPPNPFPETGIFRKRRDSARSPVQRGIHGTVRHAGRIARLRPRRKSPDCNTRSRAFSNCPTDKAPPSRERIRSERLPQTERSWRISIFRAMTEAFRSSPRKVRDPASRTTFGIRAGRPRHARQWSMPNAEPRRKITRTRLPDTEPTRSALRELRIRPSRHSPRPEAPRRGRASDRTEETTSVVPHRVRPRRPRIPGLRHEPIPGPFLRDFRRSS